MPHANRRHFLVLALALTSAPWAPALRAQPTPAVPAAPALEATLVGTWVGALVYRDYQSDKRFELPVLTRIQAVPDGVGFIRISEFDDGPKTGKVFITTVSLYDADGRKASQASFRKGRAVETWVESAEVLEWRDAEHWTVRWQHEGQDNGQPAMLRTTQTRRGSTLESTREARPLAAADSEYRVRNQSRLLRQGG